MTNPLSNISLGFIDALGISALGFAIVFFVLIALMLVIRLMRTAMERFEGPQTGNAASAATIPVPARNPNLAPAKGSLGEVKLHGVDDRTAALIMAIVADEMKAPLNELRFLSICEKSRSPKQ